MQNQLFSTGKEGLEQEFRGQLNRHTKPVQPEQLLSLKENAGNQLTVHVPSKPMPGLNSLPEKAIGDLSKIAAWLVGPGSSSGKIDRIFKYFSICCSLTGVSF